jgi:pilus assembly protein Flp/PilA
VREDLEETVPSGWHPLRLPGRSSGQGLVEYALILVLVAIIVVAVLTTMGSQLSAAFRDVVSEVTRTRS